MDLHYRNGFLIQHLYDHPHGMENIIQIHNYYGLSARNSNPLSMLSTPECLSLSKKAEWHSISEHEHILLEFISNPDLLIQYIKTCQEYSIPIRLLFVESDYNGEVWTGPDVPKKFLGYEYNTIPIDDKIITDFSWYLPLAPFWDRVNSFGLFSSLDDVTLFTNAYKQAFDRGEIGDGDMQAHTFRLYEVQPDDVLRCKTD